MNGINISSIRKVQIVPNNVMQFNPVPDVVNSGAVDLFCQYKHSASGFVQYPD
jgi:hypothetical protein